MTYIDETAALQMLGFTYGPYSMCYSNNDENSNSRDTNTSIPKSRNIFRERYNELVSALKCCDKKYVGAGRKILSQCNLAYRQGYSERLLINVLKNTTAYISSDESKINKKNYIKFANKVFKDESEQPSCLDALLFPFSMALSGLSGFGAWMLFLVSPPQIVVVSLLPAVFAAFTAVLAAVLAVDFVYWLSGSVKENTITVLVDKMLSLADCKDSNDNADSCCPRFATGAFHD